MKAWFFGGKRSYARVAALLSCFLFFSLAPVARAGETEILILHTNNVTGYLFPCPT